MPSKKDGLQPEQPLILASTSSTRRELLARLGLQFQSIDPAIDEQALPNESAVAMAYRLAHAKAEAVAQKHPQAWVIGSDQVASLDGEYLGKPLSIDNAIAQLKFSSGRTVQFDTAVSLQCAEKNIQLTRVEPFSITFRQLSETEIIRYVQREKPLWCAGSFKCEGLGISLFSRMQGEDQTALMGLPLLTLCKLLRQVGFFLP